MKLMDNVFDDLTKNWWLVALHGVAAIAFGTIAIVWPDITIGALVILFGAYAFVDGCFSIASAFQTKGDDRAFFVIRGISGVAAGIIALVWPGITALALLYVIATWAVIVGGAEIGVSISRRKQIQHAWLLGLSGALSIVFGVVLFAFPGDGAVALVMTIGIFSIFEGSAMVAAGLSLLASRHEYNEAKKADTTNGTMNPAVGH